MGGSYYVLFNGTSSYIDCGSDASLDNLPAASDMTVDAWIRADDWGGTNQGRIVSKARWRFYVSSISGLIAVAQFDTQNAAAECGLDDFTADGQWHHITMAFDFAALTLYIAIDGVWAADYDTQTPGIGVYSSDAAFPFLIGWGGAATYFDGGISWVRISDTLRWTPGVNFTAPAMWAAPAVDGSTVELWALDEGSGTTAAASVLAANNGTMTDCTWVLNSSAIGPGPADIHAAEVEAPVIVQAREL